jgi:hypothetical protein
MRANDDWVLMLRSTASEAVTRGNTRVRVELAHVKGLVAALAEAAADPVALPTTGGEYHGQAATVSEAIRPAMSQHPGHDQTGVTGLIEAILAQESRSHPPAATGAPAMASERAPSFSKAAMHQAKEDG